MAKRRPKKEEAQSAGGSNNKRPKLEDRLCPKHRGIHPDAVQAGRAPTSASTCVDCGRPIPKGEPRWGIKYAGNPLPEPVIPLYGRNPMVMWCHAGCGLGFVQLDTTTTTTTTGSTAHPALRTCHACSDSPDDGNDVGSGDENNLRLLCGGATKGRKVRSHAFHIGCWKRAVHDGSPDEECRKALLVPCYEMKNAKARDGGLAWTDLTEGQKSRVRRDLLEQEA